MSYSIEVTLDGILGAVKAGKVNVLDLPDNTLACALRESVSLLAEAQTRKSLAKVKGLLGQSLAASKVHASEKAVMAHLAERLNDCKTVLERASDGEQFTIASLVQLAHARNWGEAMTYGRLRHETREAVKGLLSDGNDDATLANVVRLWVRSTTAKRALQSRFVGIKGKSSPSLEYTVLRSLLEQDGAESCKARVRGWFQAYIDAQAQENNTLTVPVRELVSA